MDMDDPNHDLRTDPQITLTKNNDEHGNNIWKIQNIEVRYNVFTSPGFNSQLITTLNQTELTKKGYIQSPKDWKNVEMTGYFKINSFTNSEKNGAAHIELVARGGKNTNNKNLIKTNRALFSARSRWSLYDTDRAHMTVMNKTLG